MAIKCCRECIPPKRHMKCHIDCEKYLKERAELDAQNEKIRELKEIDARITNYDFNKILYASCKKRTRFKRRKR